MIAAELKAHFSNLSDPAGLRNAMDEGDIKGVLRECAFLAQVGHESMGFKFNRELAGGKAYEGRLDLGNRFPGDGERYMGRGPMQLTGRSNYRACGAALGLPLEDEPDLLLIPGNGYRAAVWFWSSGSKWSCNSYADKCTPSGATGTFVDTSGNFECISRIINTGRPNSTVTLNGKEDREKRYAALLTLHLNGPKLQGIK